MSTSRLILTGTIAVLLSLRAQAQFSPGPNPITGTVNTKQTISAGTGTVNGTLSVSGSTSGSGNVAITFTGNATVINNGTITQTGTDRAIRENTGGLTVSITNNAGAFITAAGNDAFQMNKAGSTVTLNNSGTISTTTSGSQGLNWNALNTAVGSNTLNNFSTGLIQASQADACGRGSMESSPTMEGSRVSPPPAPAVMGSMLRRTAE